MNEKIVTYHNPLYLIKSRFLGMYLMLGFLLRIVLMLTSPEDADFTFSEIVRALGIGVLSDAGMAVLLFLPLEVIYLGLNEWKYKKVAGWCIEALLCAGFIYVLCFHSIFDEYGGGAPLIAKLFIGWKLLSFSCRFFVRRVRDVWRNASLYAAWGTYVFLLLVVTVGEYFFWQEFGVRYNFIAVDYLVYTHEVIGNIMESYAIVPILIVIVLLTAGIIFLWARRNRFELNMLYQPRHLALHIVTYALMTFGACLLLQGTHNMTSENQYVTQLEQNGACDFVIAFENNKLEYDKFYPMLSERQCRKDYQALTGLNDKALKTVGDTLGSRWPNIVLITVESLSADFLTRYGNRQQLTPQIDRLMNRSLVFDSLFAVGNRTVRGLEALSLCIPPSAGESIIKQPDNHMGSLSVAAALRPLGYHAQFIYGGDSYFDNMGDFYSHNGYEVIDRADIARKDITFANIWGVCDEDVFHKSLSVFDADAARRQPFFAQIMTTSNHRPYTYPQGKIHVGGKPNTREAAVRYTDYAIGSFIREASRRPWFDNTVFVIIADHCASSAGKTSLPLDRYHIPCLMYAPRLVKPQYVGKVCSQIDIVPTLLSLLHLKATVGFAGQDILAATFRPRAFMATYQDLGYYEGNLLTVLSPIRKVRQYSVRRRSDGTFDELPAHGRDAEALRKAQTYYQYTNMYVR